MTQETQAERVEEQVPAETNAAQPAEEQAEVEAAAESTADETAAEAELPVQTEAEQIEQLRQELAAAQAKADDYLDRLQRTAAEFQNSRRRLENQMVEERERANAALIMRLLPVLDDFALAFENVEKSGAAEGSQAAWLEGFRQIQKKLLDVLAEQGVTPVETSGAFDPDWHEAVTSEPSDNVESGHIIGTLRGGYAFKGRVLRPALVRVAQ